MPHCLQFFSRITMLNFLAIASKYLLAILVCQPAFSLKSVSIIQEADNTKIYCFCQKTFLYCYIQEKWFLLCFSCFDRMLCSSMPPCFCVFSRRQTDDLPKTTNKVRIVFKPNDLAGLLYTDAIAQQCTGLTNTIVGKVVPHTESGEIFKLMT